MKRFINKHKNIDEIEDEDIEDILSKNNLAGKINKERYRDFYNALSSIYLDGDYEKNKDIDYDYFGCKSKKDINVIDELKRKEYSFLNKISKENISEKLISTSALALSYKFEKSIYGGVEKDPGDPNSTLKNIMSFYEDEDLMNLFDNPKVDDFLSLDQDMLKYIALLSNKKAFIKKSKIKEEDPAGNDIKYRPITDYSELTSASLVDLTMPNALRKILNKDVYVKKRFSSVQKSQNLMILLDNSGSMDEGIKKSMCKAIIKLKLRDINENNIYFSTFEKHVHGFMKMTKDDDFESLWNRKIVRFNMGGTEVSDVIKETIKMIKSRSLNTSVDTVKIPLSDEHFEILVINDGEDKIDESYHPDIKIHALTLVKKNEGLNRLSLRSGGTYFWLKEK